jgi:hypothetical protein
MAKIVGDTHQLPPSYKTKMLEARQAKVDAARKVTEMGLRLEQAVTGLKNIKGICDLLETTSSSLALAMGVEALTPPVTSYDENDLYSVVTRVENTLAFITYSLAALGYMVTDKDDMTDPLATVISNVSPETYSNVNSPVGRTQLESIMDAISKIKDNGDRYIPTRDHFARPTAPARSRRTSSMSASASVEDPSTAMTPPGYHASAPKYNA